MFKKKNVISCVLALALSATAAFAQSVPPSRPNDGTTGTVLYELAKINSSGNAVIATTTDTAVFPLAIVTSGAGTTGTAQLASRSTHTYCVADSGGIIAGDYVVLSSTSNGKCGDSGISSVTSSSTPTVNWFALAMSNAVGGALASIQIMPYYVGGFPATTDTRDFFIGSCSSGGSFYLSPSWSSATTSGVGGSCSGANSNIATLVFYNAGSSVGYLRLTVPAGWVGGEVDLSMDTTQSGGGAVWAIKTGCVAAGGNFDLPTYNSAQSLTSTSSSAAQILALPNLNMTGCAAGNELIVQFQRTDSTSSAPAYVADVVLTFVRNL